MTSFINDPMLDDGGGGLDVMLLVLIEHQLCICSIYYWLWNHHLIICPPFLTCFFAFAHARAKITLVVFLCAIRNAYHLLHADELEKYLYLGQMSCAFAVGKLSAKRTTFNSCSAVCNKVVLFADHFPVRTHMIIWQKNTKQHVSTL